MQGFKSLRSEAPEDEKRKKTSRPSLFKRLVPTTSTKQSSAKITGDDPEISDDSGEKGAPDIENN